MTDTHRDIQPVTAIHRKQYLACVLLALLALSPMLVLPWLNTSVAVNGADELDAWPQQAAALGLVLQNQTEGDQGLYGKQRRAAHGAGGGGFAAFPGRGCVLLLR